MRYSETVRLLRSLPASMLAEELTRRANGGEAYAPLEEYEGQVPWAEWAEHDESLEQELLHYNRHWKDMPPQAENFIEDMLLRRRVPTPAQLVPSDRALLRKVRNAWQSRYRRGRQ